MLGYANEFMSWIPVVDQPPTITLVEESDNSNNTPNNITNNISNANITTHNDFASTGYSDPSTAFNSAPYTNTPTDSVNPSPSCNPSPTPSPSPTYTVSPTDNSNSSSPNPSPTYNLNPSPSYIPNPSPGYSPNHNLPGSICSPNSNAMYSPSTPSYYNSTLTYDFNAPTYNPSLSHNDKHPINNSGSFFNTDSNNSNTFTNNLGTFHISECGSLRADKFLYYQNIDQSVTFLGFPTPDVTTPNTNILQNNDIVNDNTIINNNDNIVTLIDTNDLNNFDLNISSEIANKNIPLGEW